MSAYRAQRWSIRYPATWRATTDPNAANPEQQGSPTVTFAPNGGAGSYGVAYGVLVGVARPQTDGQQQGNQSQTSNQQQGYGGMDNNALSAAASAIVQRFLSGDSGLTQSGSMRSVHVGNLNAFIAELAGTSPVGSSNGGQPQRERDTVVVIARPDGDISYLVFVAPQGDFQTLKPVFDAMLKSFSPQ